MSLDLGSLEATLKLNTTSFIGNLKKAGQETQRVGGIIKSSAGAMASAFKMVSVAALGVGAGITGAVVGVTMMHQKMESLNRSMEFAAGGVDNANKVFGQLRGISNSLGVSIEDLSFSYSQMAAAAKGTSLTSNELVYVLKSVSQAGLVTGTSAEANQRIFRALQQMLSKGVVSMEEMKEQLGEALPMAFGVMARSLGLTVAELTKFIGTGKLVTADVLVPFARQLDKETAEAASKAGNSIASATAKMKSSWFDLQRAFLTGKVGASIGDELTSTVGIINKVTEVLKGLEPYAAKLNKYFQMASEYIIKAMTIIAPWTAAVKDNFAAWGKSISDAMFWLEPLAKLVGVTIIESFKLSHRILRGIFDSITTAIREIQGFLISVKEIGGKIGEKLKGGLFKLDVVVPTDFPLEEAGKPDERRFLSRWTGMQTAALKKQSDDWAAINQEITATVESVKELGSTTVDIGNVAAETDEKYKETIKRIQEMARKATKAIGDDWVTINKEIADTVYERSEELRTFLEDMSTTSASILGDFFSDVTHNFDSAFSNLFTRLIDEIYKMVIELLVIKPILDTIFAPLQKQAGGGMGGGFLGAITKIFGFAEGGIIREPVVGVGLKSGTGYTIAERGPEVIAPVVSSVSRADSGGAQPSAQYNITIQAMDTQTAVEYMQRNPGAVLGPITTAIQHGNKGLMGALRTAI